MRRLLISMFLFFVSTAAWAVPPHEIAVVLDTLRGMTHVEVTASDHEAKPVKYSGVPLQALVAKWFYTPTGDKLRGPWLAATVRATGADGYQVVFTLAELDATLGNLQVLVADSADGVPLSADDGPVRLVVPSDKRAARWLRGLVKLELIELKE